MMEIEISHRRIWQLAVPIMLGNISVPILGLIDTAILGRLHSPTALAGVAVASQLFTMLLWTVGFLRMGTTARSAYVYGQGNKRASYELLHDALFFIFPISLCLGLFVSITTPALLDQFAAARDVTAAATDYLVIRWWGIPAVLLQYVVIGWAIGIGRTWLPMVLLISANAVNAFLNIWFVLLLGWGIEGVAIGSVVADYFAAAISLLFIFKFRHWGAKTRNSYSKKTNIKNTNNKTISQVVTLNKQLIEVAMEWLTNWWQRVLPLIKINHQLMVRTFVLLFVFAFFTAQGAQLGTEYVAANAVLLSLLLLISNALDGFAHAAETLVGQLSGLINKKKTINQQQELSDGLVLRRRAISLTGWNTFAMAVLLSMIFAIFSLEILNQLNTQPGVLAVLYQLIPLLIFLPLAGAGSYWLDGVLLGAQMSAQMRNSMLLCATIIFFPGWFLFINLADPGVLPSEKNLYLWWIFYGFLIARTIFAIPYLKELISFR